MSSNMDNFKDFVREHPNLIGYVKRKEKSWQEFYEMYDMYLDDDDAWREYLTPNVNRSSTNSSNNRVGSYMEEIMNMAKNIDMDKVQEGISSLQKTLGLFGELFVSKKDGSDVTREYNPRPLYRRFED